MKKKTVYLSITLSIFLLLGACNSSGKTSLPEETKTTPKIETDETLQLVIVYPQIDNCTEDIDMVADEVSKITKSKINATIKLTGISVTNYAQMCRLMLVSGQKVDLMVTGTLGFMDYSGQVANDQLLSLGGLIDKNGRDIKAALGEFLYVGKIGDNIYGIPTLRDEAKAPGYAIRKDLVDKYKIDVSQIDSLEDIEPVLRIIKENEPGLAPFFPGQESTKAVDTAMRIPGGDSLANEYYFSGVLMNAQDSSLKVINYYETPEYSSMVKLIRKWNKLGYIFPGVITNDESAFDLVKCGKLASFLQDVKPGVEGQTSRQCAREMVTVPIGSAVSDSNVVTAFMWSIPVYTKTPEKAMDFLNLMYSDSSIINLLDWGMEGRHYVKQADGTIDYPPGVNSSNTGYGMNAGFIFGNQLLSYVWKGDPVDYWKRMDTFNKTAIKSKALGFQFDTSTVKTEYASCISVWQQYERALGVGAVEPDEILPVFISKLKEGGVDKVVAEKQRQLDAWAKKNGIK